MKQPFKFKINLFILGGLFIFNYPTLYAQEKNMTNHSYSPFYRPDVYRYCDSLQIDFSQEYLRLINPIRNTDKEITEMVKGYTVKADTLFSSICRIYDDSYQLTYTRITPQNGVLGKNYQHIQMYISPRINQEYPLHFTVRGKSKVNHNICNFNGYIEITHIFSSTENYPYNYMIGKYEFKEDSSQKGSGIFKGICSFDVKVDTINKIINLDKDFAIADGYNNRNYVGIWESYSRGTIKKCIWGDY